MYCVSDGMNCGSRNIYVYNVFIIDVQTCIFDVMYIYSTSLHCICFENLYGYKHTHRISYIKHKIRKFYVYECFRSEKYMYCESGNSIVKHFQTFLHH